MNNPLLNSSFGTEFELPPFAEILIEHYKPAFDQAVMKAKEDIDLIVANEEPPSFENTILALERSGALLSAISPILFNLNAAETTEDLQKVAQEISPLLTTYDSEVKQNKKLFDRIKILNSQRESLSLTQEQLRLLEKTYLGFVRSGANLSESAKKRFQEISVQLSQMQLTFGEHVLAETNSYELYLEAKEQIAGLPEDYIVRAAAAARDKGKEGQWLITLQAPSYIPVMEHAEDRSLRQQLYMAYMQKAFKGDDQDNQELIKQIVSLRQEMALLLGYKSYADYVLEERMAGKVVEVQSFLSTLCDKALPLAEQEVKELKEFMVEMGITHVLERWDWSYYSEKLRKAKYDLDDEMIKPYFQLENVIDGVFQTAEKLYELTFKQNRELPVYHKDVLAYEVYEGEDQLKAILYADYFPREGKRPGAWMTSYRDQQNIDDRVIPIISIVCNFTPSSLDSPSLLTFNEVTTLFHEFGHALHGILSDVTYPSLSGTSVYWDFVELPSQIFENWCYEPACLELFARHYQSGEIIPQELVQKIKSSATYHEAYATMRQISFALLDLSYHSLISGELNQLDDISLFEQKAMSGTSLFSELPGTNMSAQFSHIFAGGYAAGYYSYKWAEVLDADAFELFKERGVFDSSTAHSFKQHILSKGGTEDPTVLYQRFRGKSPDSNALLRRANLI
jgi:peptidyl-dipeptidase Dcp